MTRIHVVSLPHTLLTKQYDWCAYTAKVRRFVGMVHEGDHEAIVYGPDIHDELPGEYVSVVDEVDRRLWFGQPEWPIERVFDRWDAADPCWTTMNERAAQAIRARWQPGDVLGLIGGLCQAQIIRELADLHPLVTEWGIGYSGVIEGTHKVFESYAWMHHVAAKRPTDDMHFYDAVIPNCFDPDDFIEPDSSTNEGDYLLYLGRPNPRKGLAIVQDIATYSGLPLVVAGQEGFGDAGLHTFEYVGVVTGAAKARLIAGARALLCPTTYLEPFGGVAVEAQMSGTPAIATDYGAFTETIEDGLTGFRCRMLSDFVEAVEMAADLDPRYIRDEAVRKYSTHTGSLRYGRYLDQLETLYHEGWYSGVNLPASPRRLRSESGEPMALTPSFADELVDPVF